MVWEMGLSCCHSSVEWSRNGIEFGEGNIVSIILDLAKAEMRIALDGEDKGVGEFRQNYTHSSLAPFCQNRL